MAKPCGSPCGFEGYSGCWCASYEMRFLFLRILFALLYARCFTYIISSVSLDKSCEVLGINLILKVEISEAYKGLGSLFKVTASK